MTLWPIFSLWLVGQTNQYVNETTEVQINYPSDTVFKVKAEVTNDWGDRAIASINFIRDSPPTIGGATITCPSTPCQVLEEFKVELTGNWYDREIESMELYIAIFLELSDGRRIPLHSSSWEQKSFSSSLPIPLICINAFIKCECSGCGNWPRRLFNHSEPDYYCEQYSWRCRKEQNLRRPRRG